jgi:cyclic pyranopterin monophosphate synthase
MPLTHLDEAGAARMVDVGSKAATHRRAVARAALEASPETVRLVVSGGIAKGDALAVARVAGIMAAKRTADLIPLCHPIALSAVSVDIEAAEPGIVVTAAAETTGPTGVEMEAMTAASVAALTLYDMAKAVECGMRIVAVELVEKSGGRSGTWRR